jgi:hypothetical protein
LLRDWFHIKSKINCMCRPHFYGTSIPDLLFQDGFVGPENGFVPTITGSV